MHMGRSTPSYGKIVFTRNFRPCFRMAVPFAVYENSSCPISSLTLSIVITFFSHLTDTLNILRIVVSHCGFSLQLPTNGIEHFLMCLLAIDISTLVKSMPKYFTNFIWVVRSLIAKLRFFINSVHEYLARHVIYKYLS